METITAADITDTQILLVIGLFVLSFALGYMGGNQR